MKYMLSWRPSAQQRLAQIWLDAPDREAVTVASHAIDTALRRDPLHAGESREGAFRVMVAPPLAVYFDVVEADCRVSVWAVWRWEAEPPK